MSVTALVMKKKLGMGWLVLAMTIASMIISVIMVVGGMLAFYGSDSSRQLAQEDWTLAIGMALAVPAIACPIVATRMLSLIRDLNNAREELARLADTDQLTQLLNRRGFDSAARAALLNTEHSAKPVAVVMCDIDHFKQINDKYGHDFGDVALKHVAKVIADVTKKYNGIASRHGGEEFAILLPNLSMGVAKIAAEELRLACGAMPVTMNELSCRVTISAGVAFANNLQSDLTRLMSHADSALYKAKREGRDRVIADQIEFSTKAA